MKRYVGVKHVSAKPMTRREYVDYFGLALPEDVDGAEEGYLLEDPGVEANHPNHSGHVSWVAKDAFEADHTPTQASDNPPEFVNRIYVELAQLEDRCQKAGDTLKSPKAVKKMGEVAAYLLGAQHEVMLSYKAILHLRLKQILDNL